MHSTLDHLERDNTDQHRYIGAVDNGKEATTKGKTAKI